MLNKLLIFDVFKKNMQTYQIVISRKHTIQVNDFLYGKIQAYSVTKVLKMQKK